VQIGLIEAHVKQGRPNEVLDVLWEIENKQLIGSKEEFNKMVENAKKEKQ